MKIAVKLLKGELFHIEADAGDTVSVLKEKIQAAKSDLPSDRQKLIHSGKVLKETQTVSEIGITETDFVVCMVTKETRPKETTAAAPVAAPITTSAPVAAPASVPVAPLVTQPTSTAAVPATPQFASPETITALTSMGFPEAECRAALQAAMGNPDLAYEFLLTGIPEQAPGLAFQRGRGVNTGIQQPQVAATSAQPLSGIQQLRNHPQFNMLKQLIQANPSSLPQVLNLIGQQSPALLEAIHADEPAFLEMMNEPITTTPAPTAAPQIAQPPAGYGAPPMGAGGMGGMGDPAQMIQLLAAMPPAQRNQIAQQMGLLPEQLSMFMQMVSSMPPDQLQQMLAQGMGGAGGGSPPGTITLTHEEMESVNRLMALGFSQAQAAQAFIACDRNETLAANFLFENDMDGDDEGGPGDDNMYS